MSRKNIQPQHTNALPVYVRYLDLVNLCNISNQKNPKNPGFFRLFWLGQQVKYFDVPV